MQRDDLTNAGALTNGHGSSNGNSHSGLTMAPVEPRFVIEQPPAEAPPPDNSKLLVRAVLAAFRRRWLLATALGLVCGAVAAVAAWYTVPAPYTAFGEVRIYANRPKLVFSTDDRMKFDVYKGIQMRLLMGYFTLQSALRDEKIKKLSPTSAIRSEPRPVEWLEQNLRVTNLGPEFVRVSLSGEDPNELAIVVNAVMKAYVEEVVGNEEKNRLKRLTDLDALYSKLSSKIDDIRRARRRQAEAMNVPTVNAGSTKQSHLYDRALVLRKAQAEVEWELLRTEINLAARRDNQKDPQSVEILDYMLEAQLIQMPEYSRVAARASQVAASLQAIRPRLQPGSPRLAEFEQAAKAAEQEHSRMRDKLLPVARQQIIDSMDARQQASTAELENQVAVLKSRQSHLQKEIDNIKVEEKATGVLSLDLQDYDADLERQEKIAAVIFDQKQRLEIELDSPIGIELYREALPPLQRETKKKITTTAAAGFGMFGLVIAGIVLLELRSRRISSLDEVAGGLGVRVMGSLPIMPRSATAANARKNARSAFWHSVLTESIDATRTMLLREARDESHKVVMIASAMGGEGKTTLSCHLATSLARARRNVLLVDCDMRRPNVNRVFGLPLTPGLCEVLRGEAKLEDVIHTASPAGLSILPAGKINQEVLQILAQDGMDAVLKELRQQFDFVVVDSSPVLPVTDSLLISQHVDGVLFSIRRDVSRAAKVAAAMQRMSMLGVPLLGAVVIGLDDGSYGYSYGYRYGYGYGYRNAYNSVPQAR